MKVLLIEDDQITRMALQATLATCRYTIDEADDGQTGLELASQWEYDLIVLDLEMPKLDGLTLCRRLRTQGCQTPILILSVKAASEDIIAGLDAGADDYLTKPYDSGQLLARLRMLLRRARRSPVATLTWGELQLDPVAAQVMYGDQEILLTPKEYCLLELFLRHPNRVFSRTAIIDHLWALTESPTEGAVTNLIKDLRRKLRSTGIEEDVIETVYGLGYRLTKGDKPQPKANPEALEETRPTAQTLESPSDAAPLETQHRANWERGISGINQVMQRFRASLAQRVQSLADTAQLLQASTLSADQCQQSAREAHQLAGGLGTFGYVKGSELARAIEYILRNQPHLNIQQFQHLLAELQQEIAQPPTPLTELPLFETPNPSANGGFSTPGSQSNAPETKVMIVDDDQTLLDAFVAVLQPWGLTITTLANPNQFWEVITIAQPNLLVLDLEMPTVSGFELCQAVRDSPHYGNLPILVATAHTDIESIRRVFVAGADDFIGKPIAGPELITRILSRLERSHRK
jgi:DNA-binding response OmpR family regulator/HPt (histidine-containing phosphotransfer) domain-containing protein